MQAITVMTRLKITVNQHMAARKAALYSPPNMGRKTAVETIFSAMGNM